MTFCPPALLPEDIILLSDMQIDEYSVLFVEKVLTFPGECVIVNSGNNYKLITINKK